MYKKISITLALFLFPAVSFAATTEFPVNRMYKMATEQQVSSFLQISDATTAALDGGAFYSTSSAEVYAVEEDGVGALSRVIEEFTYSIPETATINSAEICHWYSSRFDFDDVKLGMTKYNGYFTGGAPSDWAKISTQTGTDLEGMTRYDWSTFTSSTYTCHSLNSTGLSWLESGSGVLTVGWRTSLDLDSTPPSVPNPIYIEWYGPAYTGQESYLSINYTEDAPPSSSSGSYLETSSGSLTLLHGFCNSYILDGSGSAIGCDEWDFSIEIQAIHALASLNNHGLYSLMILFFRWYFWLFLAWIFIRGLFNILTQKRKDYIKRTFNKFKRRFL